MVEFVLLVILVLTALWTVMARSLLRSAIGLALTSAVLSILMFTLDAPLAGVFELSVCTGLISVVFISTISLTQPLTWKEIIQRMEDRLHRFWYLPVIVVGVGLILSILKVSIGIKLPPPQTGLDVRYVLWQLRPVDLIGQVIILLAGGLGVVILFSEVKKK